MKSGAGSATFTRASIATYIDRYGVLRTAAIDTPRFEKDGYLNEGISTNLLTYSEQFDNAAWGTGAVTVSANTTAVLDPYGTNLADKLVEDSTTNVHSVYMSLIVTSATLTFSCFVKAAESTKFRLNSYESTTPKNPIIADFDLSAVTAIVGSASTTSATITPLQNGWFKVSATTTSAALVSTSFSLQTTRLGTGTYVGDGTSGLYIFGAQLEALPFASSYIPTIASTVTRANDILSVTAAGNVGKYNNEITIMADVNTIGKKENYQRILCIYNTTTSNAAHQLLSTWTSSNVSEPYFSNTYAGDTAHIVKAFNTKYRLGISILPTQVKYYIDGVLVSTLSQASNNSYPLSLIHIGNSFGAFNHFGYITNIRLYDRALTAYEVALA
jgi:hypothetical protein